LGFVALAVVPACAQYPYSQEGAQYPYSQSGAEFPYSQQNLGPSPTYPSIGEFNYEWAAPMKSMRTSR